MLSALTFPRFHYLKDQEYLLFNWNHLVLLSLVFAYPNELLDTDQSMYLILLYSTTLYWTYVNCTFQIDSENRYGKTNIYLIVTHHAITIPIYTWYCFPKIPCILSHAFWIVSYAINCNSAINQIVLCDNFRSHDGYRIMPSWSLRTASQHQARPHKVWS